MKAAVVSGLLLSSNFTSSVNRVVVALLFYLSIKPSAIYQGGGFFSWIRERRGWCGNSQRLWLIFWYFLFRMCVLNVIYNRSSSETSFPAYWMYRENVLHPARRMLLYSLSKFSMSWLSLPLLFLEIPSNQSCSSLLKSHVTKPLKLAHATRLELFSIMMLWFLMPW